MTRGAPATSATPESYLGRVIAGRYALERLLGRGGMGLVFQARHVAVGRRVAVKILRPEYARSDEAVARFHREAKAAASVGSPHIVEVIDFGYSEDGGAYLAMELLEGEDLAALLRRKGPLEPSRAVALARQVAEALAAAHGRGIVHRDLKSGNVFVSRGDRVKVLDFGVSKVLDPSDNGSFDTAQGAMIGTAHYMAPEQASDGRGVDARADLYSLGCILFEMLTGELPFVGATPVEVLYKHVHESPRRPSSIRPGVPRALDALVLKLLAKDREGRPPDARAVLAALEQREHAPVRRGVVALAAAAAVGAAAWALRPAPRVAPVTARDAGVVVTEPAMTVARDAPEERDVAADVAAEATAREVVATLVVQPEGAGVTADGEPVVVRSGVATVRRAQGSAVLLRATAPGHLARVATVTLADDVALRWTLAEVAPQRVRVATDAGARVDAAAAVGGSAPPDGLHASPYHRAPGARP